jgi:hypothetical protein
MTQPQIIKALIASVGCGLVLASVMIALGFSHNSQAEFYLPNGTIDYKYSLGLFGSWFVVGALGGLLLYFLFCWVLKVSNRNSLGDS